MTDQFNVPEDQFPLVEDETLPADLAHYDVAVQVDIRVLAILLVVSEEVNLLPV